MPLPMAQIPQFSLGATPTTANIGQGINEGLNQGYSSYLAQQALAQKQQELEMAKQQQTISQVDTLLKAGLNYDGMLPSLWPAIATRMNTLSPDYKLDPSNPPENIQSFAKRLSSISDGLNDKVFSPPQAHNATVQLIQDSFPQPVAGTMDNSGQPVTQAPQGQPSQQPGMAPAQGQPTPQQGAPQPQQPPSNPLTDFATIKAQYDKANQLISQAPMEGPQSQEVLRKQLESSSLGLNYKKALDQLATTANQQYTEGEQNNRNLFNQNQDSVRNLGSSFTTNNETSNQTFKQFGVFDSQMNTSDRLRGASDTTGSVQAERSAMFALSQMMFSGSQRPGSPEMMESMANSGSLGTLFKQAAGRWKTGDIMTPEQVLGAKQTAFGILSPTESKLSDDEVSTANAISTHGADARGFIKDMRPSYLASTSKIFPQNASPNLPQVGGKYYAKVGGKVGWYQLIGTDRKSSSGNWIPTEPPNGQ